MGLWQHLFGVSEKQKPIVLSGKGTFLTDVVGESHYQDNLEKICGRRKWDGVDLIMDAMLFLDDNNEHDRNAVCVRINGFVVGHLGRKQAIKYRQKLGQKAVAICKANIRGGWKRGKDDIGHYGVWLDLP